MLVKTSPDVPGYFNKGLNQQENDYFYNFFGSTRKRIFHNFFCIHKQMQIDKVILTVWASSISGVIVLPLAEF
jgi:hypothetical protein